MFDPTIQLLDEMSRLRSARNELLASNVANAHTPGYQAKDARFAVELKQASAALGPMAHTDPNHIGAPQGLGPGALDPVTRPDATAGPDGNTVSLDAELGKMSTNAAEAAAYLRILKRKFQLIHDALNGA
ncbi:MAG: flagellar basal body rod protein FlgB [Deltaproteobacteria bacterium]|nr:flagellar basal body rod protein FlgB [Deltaproteobacteria bacterium]